jgi:hypothetical protein
MIAIIHNIISFFATFLVISSTTMIVLQTVLYIHAHYHQRVISEKMENIVVIIGCVIALLMIPFYYFPY